MIPLPLVLNIQYLPPSPDSMLPIWLERDGFSDILIPTADLRCGLEDQIEDDCLRGLDCKPELIRLTTEL